MAKKKSKLVWKKCKECGRKQEVLPEVDKCYACDQEGALKAIEVISEVPENSGRNRKTQKRDHRKGRRVGSFGARV